MRAGLNNIGQGGGAGSGGIMKLSSSVGPARSPKPEDVQAEAVLAKRPADAALASLSLVFTDPELEAAYIQEEAGRLGRRSLWSALAAVVLVAAIVMKEAAFYLYAWKDDEKCKDLFSIRCRALGLRLVVALFFVPAFFLLLLLHRAYYRRVRMTPAARSGRTGCCIACGGVPLDVTLSALFALGCFVYSRTVNDKNSSFPVDYVAIAVFLVCINSIGALFNASFATAVLSLISYLGYAALTVGFAFSTGEMLYSSDYSASTTVAAGLAKAVRTLSMTERRYEIVWALFWPLAALICSFILARGLEISKRQQFALYRNYLLAVEQKDALIHQKAQLWKELGNLDPGAVGMMMGADGYGAAEGDFEAGSPLEKAMALLRDVQRDTDMRNDSFLKLRRMAAILSSAPDLLLGSGHSQQAVTVSHAMDAETERWVLSLVDASSSAEAAVLGSDPALAAMVTRRKSLNAQEQLQQQQHSAAHASRGSSNGGDGSSDYAKGVGGSAFPLLPGNLGPARLPSLLTEHEESLLQSMVLSTEDWDFDLVEVQRVTKNHPLLFVGVTLFRKYDFLNRFNIPMETLTNFFKVVEAAYNDKPYHNSTHAADVMRTSHYMITKGEMRDYLTDLEMLCALIAAAVHDVGHPGINNQFHVASKHELALLYNDRSVLENYHAAYAFRLLMKPENNILAHLPPRDYDEARKIIVDLVLGTDLAHHFEHIGTFKQQYLSGSLNVNNKNHRLIVNKVALKAADVGHFAKNNKLHLVWTERVMEEFYKQGDQERKRGLPISPFMDRRKPKVARSQVGFIDFIVQPMYEYFFAWIDRDLPCVDRMLDNKAYWLSQLSDADRQEMKEQADARERANAAAAAAEEAASTTSQSASSRGVGKRAVGSSPAMTSTSTSTAAVNSIAAATNAEASGPVVTVSAAAVKDEDASDTSADDAV